MPVTVDNLPNLTPSDVALQQTRFSSWFPSYRQYSIKASFIDVLDTQTDFVQWLAEDGKPSKKSKKAKGDGKGVAELDAINIEAIPAKPEQAERKHKKEHKEKEHKKHKKSKSEVKDS